MGPPASNLSALHACCGAAQCPGRRGGPSTARGGPRASAVFPASQAPCRSPFPLHASSCSISGQRKEIKVEERDRRKKRYFTTLLSPQKLEINILLDEVSNNKFAKNQSVLQQIVTFLVSSSKVWLL